LQPKTEQKKLLTPTKTISKKPSLPSKKASIILMQKTISGKYNYSIKNFKKNSTKKYSPSTLEETLKRNGFLIKDHLFGKAFLKLTCFL
jgi:hypothetical protein